MSLLNTGNYCTCYLYPFNFTVLLSYGCFYLIWSYYSTVRQFELTLVVNIVTTKLCNYVAVV